MAQTVATPANLNDFAQQLGTSLAETLGGGGGSGDSNYVGIGSYVAKNAITHDDIPHLYIAVEASISLEDVTLRYCRKKRTKCRRKGLTYHDNGDGYNAKTRGWHQVWCLPLHSTKTPLFVPVLKNASTPDFTIGGIAYYEVTVGNYNTFYDFATDAEYETGYLDADKEPVSIGTILSKAGGICLIKDGKQISNFATFRLQYNEDRDEWSIGR
ncbi:MAG: hypothetical protein IJS13_07225 [Paludibacteraceae bacterium]|nr:hypothetical protein [Paludibacteraceae bacterium]